MSSINMGSSKASIGHSTATNRQDRPGGSGRSGMKADFEKAAIAAGIDPNKLKDIEAQIQSELKKAQSNPGLGFSLGATIDSVLKASGANLDTFHSEMQKLHDQRHSNLHPPVYSSATKAQAN